MQKYSQQQLAEMYAGKQRPVCGCTKPGVEMYIAKVGDQYIIKRMPESGAQHAPTCDSYEPPAEVSGLSEVLGTAIRPTADGAVDLKVGFSLSVSKGDPKTRTSTNKGDKPKDLTPKDDQGPTNKLSLLAMLHYFWTEAGLNRWSPRVKDKRGWNYCRVLLQNAAAGLHAGKYNLSARLFIPRSFADSQREEVKREWQTLISASAGTTKTQPLLMLLGELKAFKPTKWGYQMQIKHAPDAVFSLKTEVHDKLSERYPDEFALMDTPGVRLIILATFRTIPAGVSFIEDMAIMAVTDRLLPFESANEKALIDQLVADDRLFLRGLRFNLPKSRPLASAVLLDTKPAATALYTVPADADGNYHAELDLLIRKSQYAAWQWDTNEFDVPALPPRAA